MDAHACRPEGRGPVLVEDVARDRAHRVEREVLDRRGVGGQAGEEGRTRVGVAEPRHEVVDRNRHLVAHRHLQRVCAQAACHHRRPGVVVGRVVVSSEAHRHVGARGQGPGVGRDVPGQRGVSPVDDRVRIDDAGGGRDCERSLLRRHAVAREQHRPDVDAATDRRRQ